MATILVIDDQEQIRGLLRAALEGDGHEVLEASNGLLGLERSRERTADVIILDLLMPEMNGLELMVELKRSAPHVKIIAISGSLKGEGGLLAAKRLGAHHTFQKPFELTAVLEAVRDELAHEPQRMTSPQIGKAQPLGQEWKPQPP
jgi:two-component system response regulator (stage 0 sporulation protein F)